MEEDDDAPLGNEFYALSNNAELNVVYGKPQQRRRMSPANHGLANTHPTSGTNENPVPRGC
jgi:hypothetical protein